MELSWALLPPVEPDQWEESWGEWGDGDITRGMLRWHVWVYKETGSDISCWCQRWHKRDEEEPEFQSRNERRTKKLELFYVSKVQDLKLKTSLITKHPAVEFFSLSIKPDFIHQSENLALGVDQKRREGSWCHEVEVRGLVVDVRQPSETLKTLFDVSVLTNIISHNPLLLNVMTSEKRRVTCESRFCSSDTQICNGTDFWWSEFHCC